LAVARDVAGELGSGGAEMVFIPDALRKPPKQEADIVGIFVPVYMFGLPRIVDEFCRNVSISSSAYVFGVATYGGMSGMALKQMRRILAKRGIKLAAGFGVKMPGNYTPLYGAPSPAKQKRLFDKARATAKKIATIVRERKSKRIPAGIPFINALFDLLMYRPAMKRIQQMDTQFVVTGKCNGCGVCTRVCPTQNIRMQNNLPTWQHKCEHCLGCLQWCPQQAIEYGKVTVGRTRYHHPDITTNDMRRLS
jgi:ferredoxin